MKICATPITGMIHAQVKAEILRAGNDLDFMVKKRDFNVVAYNQTMQQIAASNRPIDVASNSPEPRAEIVEEHLWRHGGPTFKNVQPKSYKILEQQLPQSSMGGPAPGSVFDRSMDERSPYLQATEQTIQKAYGES
ncbi:unnamed protein product [Schistosoma mattheei]|uniref:Uncharacterized protein n=1 Tax=Schistosoma mattheei TaxID=31246 RepID=A0A3P8IE64_9TREM|nr:unnamed protein product [Schistosoma mattheei]